jgi:hypothetical protein
MKKTVVALSIGLSICLGFLLAQDNKPYTTKFTKAGGECLFTGKTFDEVWGAAANALVSLKYNITVAQKDSGMLTASKGPTTAGVIAFGLLAKGKHINLIVKTQENGIYVRGNIKPKKGVIPLFEEMAKILYPQ